MSKSSGRSRTVHNYAILHEEGTTLSSEEGHKSVVNDNNLSGQACGYDVSHVDLTPEYPADSVVTSGMGDLEVITEDKITGEDLPLTDFTLKKKEKVPKGKPDNTVVTTKNTTLEEEEARLDAEIIRIQKELNLVIKRNKLRELQDQLNSLKLPAATDTNMKANTRPPQPVQGQGQGDIRANISLGHCAMPTTNAMLPGSHAVPTTDRSKGMDPVAQHKLVTLGSDNSKTTSGATNLPTLSDLRKFQSLEERVQQSMHQFGLGDALQPQQTFECDTGRNVLQGKNLKSGQDCKITDKVVNQLTYAHTNLKYSWANMGLKYSDLDFPLLVAGELSTIKNDSISDVEKQGRLELLIATAYHTKTYYWNDVLNFHRTYMFEIEKGERQWGNRDSFISVEANTLYNRPVKSVPFNKKPDQPRTNQVKRWFCKAYQTGNCSLFAPHDAMVLNKTRTVEHICAACYQKQGVASSHSESSTSCPYYKS